MSGLSDRKISRKVSRPNARKALERIRKELLALIEKSPNISSITDEMWRESARADIETAVRSVQYLYRGAGPQTAKDTGPSK